MNVSEASITAHKFQNTWGIKSSLTQQKGITRSDGSKLKPDTFKIRQENFVPLTAKVIEQGTC